MAAIHIAIFSALLYPISDDPLRDRTPDEVDPYMAWGGSKPQPTAIPKALGLGVRSDEFKNLLELNRLSILGFREIESGMSGIQVRAIKSAMSGIELPPEDKAELQKFRKKTALGNGGSGTGRAATAGADIPRKALIAPYGPKTGEEFDRMYREWSATSEDSLKLMVELKGKIAAGTASETELRKYDGLRARQAYADYKRQQKIEELERDFDWDLPKP